MIDIVNFYPKTFQDVPDQDNPAYGDKECLMLVSESDFSKHVDVLHIIPGPVESVNHVAKFWLLDKALEYCDFLSKPILYIIRDVK